MSTIAERLQTLYAERAALVEQIQATKERPELTAKFGEAAKDPDMNRGMAKLMVSAMAVAKGEIDEIKEQIGWCEQQIITLLGNPGLGSVEAHQLRDLIYAYNRARAGSTAEREAIDAIAALGTGR